MANLTLTQEELQQLDVLIGNTPTKFGLPIVQFFQLVQQKRNLEKAKLEQPKKLVESKVTSEKLPYLKAPDDAYNGKQVQEKGDQETVTDQENHPF